MCDEFYFGSNSDLKVKAHPTKVLQFIKSLISKAITNERARIVEIIESIQSTEDNSFSFALEQFKKILINQINKD